MESKSHNAWMKSNLKQGWENVEHPPCSPKYLTTYSTPLPRSFIVRNVQSTKLKIDFESMANVIRIDQSKSAYDCGSITVTKLFTHPAHTRFNFHLENVFYRIPKVTFREGKCVYVSPTPLMCPHKGLGYRGDHRDGEEVAKKKGL